MVFCIRYSKLWRKQNALVNSQFHHNFSSKWRKKNVLSRALKRFLFEIHKVTWVAIRIKYLSVTLKLFTLNIYIFITRVSLDCFDTKWCNIFVTENQIFILFVRELYSKEIARILGVWCSLSQWLFFYCHTRHVYFQLKAPADFGYNCLVLAILTRITQDYWRKMSVIKSTVQSRLFLLFDAVS